MTTIDYTDVKLKALVRFPNAVQSGVGINASVSSGIYTIARDDSGLEQVANVSAGDLPNTRVSLWNSVTNSYSTAPFALAATAGVASLGGQTGILDLGFGLEMAGSTLRSTAVPSAGADVGAWLRSAGTAAKPIYRKSGFISTEEYLCAGDGVTPDDDAFDDFLDALEARGGGGAYIHGPLLLAREHTCRTGGVTFFGDNSFSAGGFIVADGTILGNGLLQFSNLGEVTFKGLYFNGSQNTLEAGPGGTAFIGYFGDENAEQETIKFAVRRCAFINAKASNYIFLAQHADAANTFQMRNVTIENNYFFAAAGFAPVTGGGNTFIGIRGNTLSGTTTDDGGITNIRILNNFAQGYGCSGFVNGLYNFRDIVCANNTTQFMGNSTIATETSYTYALYASAKTSRAPRDIVVVNNTGHGNHGHAVYAAGAEDITVNANVFTDTRTSSTFPTLPHGFAIAFNGCKNLTCIGNDVRDNPGGIYYGQDRRDVSNDVIVGNAVSASSVVGFNAIGIEVNPDPEALSSDSLTQAIIANNPIRVTGAGCVGIKIIPNVQMGRVKILDNSIKAEVQGISADGVIATELTFAGNTISGELTNYPAVINAGSSPLKIRGETVDFSEVLSGSSNGYNLDGCTNVTIDGLSLANKTNGSYALSMVGTRGRCKGVTFPGTTSTRVAATSSGLSTPGWTGNQFDTWQNFQASFYTETGSTPKYTLDCFVWSTSTTWLERRFPTGG